MGLPATNSALAKLTVSKAVYDKDLLLQWVSQVASPLQLEIQVDKKSPLKLEAQNTVLASRNAILRALCGTVLHGALDQAPYYLLGGSGTASPVKVGQLVQWMSVADSVRSNDASSSSVLSQLETLLERKSFLIGSSQASLADYDMALVLKKEEMEGFGAVQRWYNAVMWSFQQHAKDTLPVPVSIPEPAAGPLIFFNGMEDVDAVLKPPAPKKAKQAEASGGGNAKGGQGQPQQQQQQQQGGKKKKGGDQPQQQQGNKGGGGGGAKAAPAPASFDISALDIRVGKIVKAWHHEEAEKLFCEDVDLGTETRKIASGLRPFYKTEDLEGRLVLVLCNLKKRNLVGFPSHGMVMCASNADHTKVEFVVPPEGSKPGDKVTFENYEGEPEPENKVGKKKIFEGLAPDLKTDEQGNVVWKGSKAKTEAGVVRALNGMPNAQVS